MVDVRYSIFFVILLVPLSVLSVTLNQCSIPGNVIEELDEYEEHRVQCLLQLRSATKDLPNKQFIYDHGISCLVNCEKCVFYIRQIGLKDKFIGTYCDVARTFYKYFDSKERNFDASQAFRLRFSFNADSKVVLKRGDPDEYTKKLLTSFESLTETEWMKFLVANKCLAELNEGMSGGDLTQQATVRIKRLIIERYFNDNGKSNLLSFALKAMTNIVSTKLAY